MNCPRSCWLLLGWRAGQLRLVVAAGAVAFLVFLPWMVRDWLVFGSPLRVSVVSVNVYVLLAACPPSLKNSVSPGGEAACAPPLTVRLP